jgi:hypothetical protein
MRFLSTFGFLKLTDRRVEDEIASHGRLRIYRNKFD